MCMKLGVRQGVQPARRSSGHSRVVKGVSVSERVAARAAARPQRTTRGRGQETECCVVKGGQVVRRAHVFLPNRSRLARERAARSCKVTEAEKQRKRSQDRPHTDPQPRAEPCTQSTATGARLKSVPAAYRRRRPVERRSNARPRAGQNAAQNRSSSMTPPPPPPPARWW